MSKNKNLADIPEAFEVWFIMIRACVAIGFSIYGLYLRALCYANRDWSIDEVTQYQAALGPLKSFWQRLPSGEVTCFPGDYLLTYPFVHIFEPNKWGVVIPHIMATILGFYFLYLICRRYLKSTWATAMAFLIYALNSELIFHAFELRPYPVLASLGLMVFYCTETIVCSKYNSSLFKKIGIGFLFFWTILYHTYGIVIVGFCALFSILKERSNASWPALFKRILPFYVIVGIFSFPPWLWYASYNAGPDITSSPTFEYIPNPLVNTLGFLKGVLGNLLSPRFLHPLVAGPILAFLIPQPSRIKYIGFWLTLIVLPISLLCALDASLHYWFIQRQFIWVISLFSFFVAWGWESVILGLRTKLLNK